MRKNGWQAPFHYLQLVTWVFFPAIMAMFFAFFTPILDLTGAILGSAAYGTTCVIVVWAVCACTGTNPADDSILRPTVEAHHVTTVGEDQVYCNVCLHYVQKDSRHCRLCDKCVEVFDHHCKWLNNCVGKKNYRYFLTSVVGATVMLATQVSFGIFLFYQCHSHPNTIKQRSAAAYGCSIERLPNGLCQDDSYRVSLLALKVIYGLLLAFLGPWCFLIAQLAFFHFQLCVEDITTYDYIVRKRKRRLQNGRDQTVYTPWWKLLLARMCGRQRELSSGDKSQSTSSHISQQSALDEQMAIEADVDDEMEVLSARSSDVTDPRASYTRESSRERITPKRGFGRHVSFEHDARARQPSNGFAHTPEEANYLAAPCTPQSPRSDPESAYVSEMSDSVSSSMVMYGRPSAPPHNHVI